MSSDEFYEAVIPALRRYRGPLDEFALHVRTILPYGDHIAFCAAIGADPEKLHTWAINRVIKNDDT